MKKVLVDTSIWIEYFKGNKMVQELVHDTNSFQCYIVGSVLTELLLGIKTTSEKERLITCMNALPMLDIENDDWINAGNTGNLLRQKGITIPLPDLIIFNVAAKNNCAIFSLDKHFDIIKDIIKSELEIVRCK